MAYRAEAEPSLGLLKQAGKVVFDHIGVFVLFGGLGIVVVFGLVILSDPILSAIGFPRVETATDPRWVTHRLGEIVLILPGVVAWSGLYGVTFSVLAGQSQPWKGFANGLKRLLPVFALYIVIELFLGGYDFLLGHFGISDSSWESLVGEIVLTSPLAISFAAMVGLDMGPAEAAAYSIRRFFTQPLRYFLYYLGAFLFAALGLFAFGVGFFATVPIFVMAMCLLVTRQVVAGPPPAATSPYPRGSHETF